MKIIKLLFISAIFFSVKAVSEIKLYEIVIDLSSNHYNLIPPTENGNYIDTNYTIKFLLDDERTPDRNIGGMQYWDTISNVVSMRSDGASFSVSGDERTFEYTHPAQCWYNSIGFEFQMDVGVMGELKIEGCNPGIFLDPNNTFSLGEVTDSFVASVTIDGCGVFGCLSNAETEVNIVSINVNSFIGVDNDGDTIPSGIDNCPNNINPNQLDNDNDDVGNACDTTPNGDDDGDGIDNASDNCPNKENSDQTNLDGDSKGDACDLDVDGDSVIDTLEVAAGTDPNDPSDGDQAELSILEFLGINKQVPAMGGLGLLILGLSILSLGFIKSKKK